MLGGRKITEYNSSHICSWFGDFMIIVVSVILLLRKVVGIW